MEDEIILGMYSANVKRCYLVTPPLISWAHMQDDTWIYLHILKSGVFQKCLLRDICCAYQIQ